MRRNNKKRLIPLALALALSLISAALAVPAISFQAQRVGGGADTTVRVDTSQANVTWTISGTTITGATITLDQGPGVDSNWNLYVYLENGTVIQRSGTILSGSTSISVTGLNIDLTQTYITTVSIVISQQ